MCFQLLVTSSYKSIGSSIFSDEREESGALKQDEKMNTSKQSGEDNLSPKEEEDETHRPSVRAWIVGIWE